MTTEKKWLAIMVEVETYDGEVQSIHPVDAETSEYFSLEELKEIHKFLEEDDDAEFDFMWEFNALISEAIVLEEAIE